MRHNKRIAGVEQTAQLMNSNLKYILTLLFCSIIFFILGNNLISLTNPDEVFYSQSAKEMIQHDTWMVPYIFGQPQFEKPIFLYWLLRLGYAMFGIGSFGARFFPACFAVLGCLTCYFFCKLVYKNEKKAFFCSVIMMSSALYIGLARIVLTDMIFSVFIFLSLVSFYFTYLKPDHKFKGMMLACGFSALAVLTKGALGFVFPAAIIILFLLVQRQMKFLYSKALLWGIALFLILTIPWYAYLIKLYGGQFISEFVFNDHVRRIFEAEHRGNDTWYFYPMTMVLGMMPWSVPTIFAFFGLPARLREGKDKTLYFFLLSCLGGGLGVVLIAHSKLVSYIFPVFPALAIITADYLWNLISEQKNRIFFINLLLSSLLVMAISIALLLVSSGKIPITVKYYEYLPDSAFVLKFFWGSFCLIAGAFFFFWLKRPKGSICILALQVPMILMMIFLFHDKYEPYISSKQASEYLLKNRNVENTILCSKMFARGIRFYTDKDVAVLGEKFFSPHPILMLNTDSSILDFLSRQKTSYAIVKKSQFAKLQTVTQGHFVVNELKHLGDAYIIEIRSSL